ncbi:MAG TPA: hypothetical protein EYO83_06915 [Gemmatimonadetes bacterium]|nr:hypothetical protein [Gemmatimonadota bacterium]
MTKSLLTLGGAIFIGTFLLSLPAEAQRTDSETDMADVESIGSIIIGRLASMISFTASSIPRESGR